VDNGTSVGVNANSLKPQIEAITMLDTFNTFLLEHQKLANQTKRSGHSLFGKDLNSCRSNTGDLLQANNTTQHNKKHN
jgi:hypothetical protein